VKATKCTEYNRAQSEEEANTALALFTLFLFQAFLASFKAFFAAPVICLDLVLVFVAHYAEKKIQNENKFRRQKDPMKLGINTIV